MKSRLDKEVPQLAKTDECTGCMACIGVCSQNAIRQCRCEDGHLYVSVDNEKCVGCLACEAVCKSSREKYGVNDLSKSEVFAAWSQDNECRKRGTSGGVAGALALSVISSGGVAVGACIDKTDCSHRVIRSKDEIISFQGSKYMISDMCGIYSEIEKELASHDVLFTGLGCQCAGVLSYFEKKRFGHCLYVVDIVCGGLPSRILIDKYLANNEGVEAIRSFREKDKYSFSVLKHGKEEREKEKCLPLDGFGSGMTNRINCYNCQFAKAHRKTDLTLGDLWDKTVFQEERAEGISMVIVHSEKGRDLLKQSGIELKRIGWEKALLQNPRTVCGKQRIYLPRKQLIVNSKKLSEGRFHDLYCVDMKPKDIDLFVFRIYRFVIQKLIKWRNKQYIMKLIKKYGNGVETKES